MNASAAANSQDDGADRNQDPLQQLHEETRIFQTLALSRPDDGHAMAICLLRPPAWVSCSTRENGAGEGDRTLV